MKVQTTTALAGRATFLTTALLAPSVNPRMPGSSAADNLVSLWAQVQDPEPPTLVSGSVASDSGADKTVVSDLERPMSEVRHLRGTSVPKTVNGQQDRPFRVHHLHVSPAQRHDD